MDFKKLENLMESFVDWRIPGCSAVVYLEGKKVFGYSAGYADVEAGIRMDREKNSMYMYSASKPVTCALALMLWEEGKFLLDEPLSDYLPEWKNVSVREQTENGWRTVPASREILIGDLFSMTSGLDYNTGGESFQAAIKKYSPECKTTDMIAALAKDAMACQPGEKWLYGMSHDVIGALIETISGESLRDFAKKRIFEPLGMEKSFYAGANDRVENAPVQYTFNDEKNARDRDWQGNWFLFGDKFYSGGAGIVSTVPDMAKFAAMMCEGGKSIEGRRLLSENTVKLMRTNRLTERQMRGTDDWSVLRGYGYGLGVRTMMDPAEGGSPSSVGEFGWCGAAGAYMLADREKRLAMFYSHYMLNNQEYFTAPRLRNVLYSCI